MNNRNKILGAAAATAVMTGITIAVAKKKQKENYPDLDVVNHVDLDKYLGEWYEIARMPAPFEKNCYVAKAEYSKNADGTIKVVNSCHKHSIDGPVKVSTAKAFVVDKETNAKLKVQFFWPFKGDYWILDLDDNYQYALVGEPSRKYMWILSRTSQIALEAMQDLLDKAKAKGFNTDRLIYTEQLN